MNKSVGYKIGDTVKFYENYEHVSKDTLCTVLNIEPGTFPGDFYTTVQLKSGEKIVGYSWRWGKV